MTLRQSAHYRAVLICFVFSGFAGLLYQTVWMRHFSLVFGTSELAVVTVLVAYMAGLAIGAAAAGAAAVRLNRNPVLVYGILELAIAGSAFFVPKGIEVLRAFHRWSLGGQPELPSAGGLSSVGFYLVSGVLILLVPTACMGATLPILVKGLVRRERDISRRMGVLYGSNALGAALGTLTTAFVLVPELGIKGTVYIGILLNLAIGILGIFVLARTSPDASVDSASVSPPAPVQKPSPCLVEKPDIRWTFIVLPLIFLSGSLSFGYEVFWTRLLGFLLGGSLAAFATMLASFLIGITLGSFVAGRFAESRRRSAIGLAAAQIAVAALTMAAFSFIGNATEFFLGLKELFGGGTIADAMVAMCVLLPAAFCIGMTFPCSVRVLSLHHSGTPAVSARVYAWNTAGAICGALAAAFVGIPLFKFEGFVAIAVTGNLLLGLAAAMMVVHPRRRMIAVALGATALVVGAYYRPSPPEAVLRTSPFAGAWKSQRDVPILYYGAGRSATVVAFEKNGSYRMTTNGLPEADMEPPGSLNDVYQSDAWMAKLPFLARPQARSCLVVGLGSGGIIHHLPPQVAPLDVVELEQEVIECNRAMAPVRRSDPLSREGINIVVNDARGALNLTARCYDAVISQPSHPWSAGASHLYTSEFFQLVRDHLTEEGVFLQWIGSEYVDEKLFGGLVRSFLDVFQHVRIYCWGGPIYLLASDSPLEIEAGLSGLDSIDHLTGLPGLSHLEDLAAALWMDSKMAKDFSARFPPITDDHNRLATHSFRLNKKKSLMIRAVLDPILQSYNTLGDPESGFWQNPDLSLDRVYLQLRLSRLFKMRRGHLEKVLTPEERDLSEAITAYGGEGWFDLKKFDRVLESDSSNREARFYKAYYRARRISQGQRPANQIQGEALEMVRKSVDPDQWDVLQGLALLREGNFEAIRDLDERLATATSSRDSYHVENCKSRLLAWLDLSQTAESWEERKAAAAKTLSIVEPLLEMGYTQYAFFRIRLDAARHGGFKEARNATYWKILGKLSREISLYGKDPQERKRLWNEANRTVDTLRKELVEAEGGDLTLAKMLKHPIIYWVEQTAKFEAHANP